MDEITAGEIARNLFDALQQYGGSDIQPTDCDPGFVCVSWTGGWSQVYEKLIPGNWKSRLLGIKIGDRFTATFKAPQPIGGTRLDIIAIEDIRRVR